FPTLLRALSFALQEFRNRADIASFGFCLPLRLGMLRLHYLLHLRYLKSVQKVTFTLLVTKAMVGCNELQGRDELALKSDGDKLQAQRLVYRLHFFSRRNFRVLKALAELAGVPRIPRVTIWRVRHHHHPRCVTSIFI